MEPIQIRTFDKPLDIRLTGDFISLPPELRIKIDSYWQDILKLKPKLRNGEVFTVNSVEEDTEAIHIGLDETNYAHYLYSQQSKDLSKYTVRIIHPAALVISTDNQMIFGTMGPHTSIAGTIQCCGGGIDRHAITPDGVVSVDKTMASELAEELGIMTDDERVISVTPMYLKFGGPTGKMTLLYIVKLNVTGKDFAQDYADFAESLKTRNEEPEFDEVFCINSDPTTVDAFIQNHEHELNEYMPILLRTVAGK